MQEGSLQGNEQRAQTRGERDKVGREPKEERLTKAHSFKGDLRDLPHRKPAKRERPELEGPEPNPTLYPGTPPTLPTAPSAPGLPAPAVQAPSPSIVFEGLDRENWGAGSPPDTNGDVGPTYYIQSVNTSVGIYRKSDGFREAAFTFDTLMSQGNFGNLCDTNNFGDPVVLYDTFEDRWILTDFAFLTDISGNVVSPAYQCFAVSMNGNPVTGGWNFYSTQVADFLNDYPKLGVWTDGLYMSANMFSFGAASTFQGVRLWAFNKAQMYAGSPTVKVISFNLGSGDFTVVPANARLQTGTPPPGRPNLFLSTWNFTNAVSVYKFHVDWNSISLSTFTGPDVPIAGTSWPNAAVGNAPQPGTATLLDVLQIRAMVQNQYTNFAGAESLWVPHTVRRANTTGFAAPRWYQVNITGGTVAASLPQATTWDPDAANVIHRYMPSLALDRAGNMAMGYTTSSSTQFPSMRYAGRLSTDPVNTFSQTEQTLFTGTASQTGTTRWGDYSSMMLDPDGCTFWYTNEYANPADQTFNHRWLTKIGSFKFAECIPVGTGGTVSGAVTDSATSNPISGATVALGSRTATTNASGVYTFLDIPAGTYPSITASFAGYGSSTVTSIVVADAATTTQDFSLTAAPTTACLTDTTQADFLLGVLTNVDLNTSPGDVTLINLAIDQQNTAGTTTGTGFGTPSWTGQTFIPAVNGQLVKADIQLFCNGCGATPPNLTLSVRGTAAGLPTGADLASVTIPGSVFSSGATVTYTASFGSPATLTSGTQYALILRPVSVPAGSGYFWIRSSPSTYASGSRVLSADSGGTWSSDTTRDYNFKAYMQGPYAPTSGNLVSGTRDANPAAGLTPIWSTFSWNATVPLGTSLMFQLAGSNSANGPFNFVGPDGTVATFFTTSPASLSQFYGMRYLQYKAFLSTTDSAVTPSLNDVTVCFENVDCSGTAPVITPSPAEVCPNSTGNTASGPGGMTAYAWAISNGTITSSTNEQSVTYTAGASGSVTLTLTVTTPSGCITPNSTLVTINSIPATPTITPGGPTTFCAGDSVTLTSSSASGNQWYLNGNPIGGATNQAYIATAAGDYTDVVTASGCVGAPSPATTVTVNPLPATPTITPDGPTTFCTGGSVALTSSSATGNQWFLNGNPIGGATNQAYIATASGSYTVIDTANGCSSSPSAATTVTVNPIPATPTITPGGPTTFFAGGSVALTSSSASGNQWYLNGNPIGGATNQDYIATASGNYTVIVTESGCTSSPSTETTVTVNPVLPPTISKIFLPDTVAPDGTTLLSFTISNPNSDPDTDLTLNGIAFTDNLPAGLVIASPNELSNDCGGTVTATPGSTLISLSGGVLAPAAPGELHPGQALLAFYRPTKVRGSADPAQGTCFISVKVQAPSTLGTLDNTTGPIAADESGPGTTSNTASLTVTAPPVPPTIAKEFGAASIPLNGTTSLTFTFTNPNTSVLLMNVSAIDTLPIGLVVANLNSLNSNCEADISAEPGSSVIGITALNLPPSGTCSFSVNVTGSGAGTKNNISDNVSASYEDASGDFVPIIGGAATATTQVLKGDQTITFGELTNKTFGDADFSVSATSSSGLQVSLTATGNCTVTGASPGIVHLTGAGSCTITASQSGDPNYNPATSVPQSFTIAQSNQTITFSALANKTLGDPDFSVSATASSDLAVSFIANGQCTISGATVHITDAGSCTITASQAGDTNFNAAADVPQSFIIANTTLVSLGQSTYSANEAAGFVTITVNRTGDLSVSLTVDYATDDTGSSNVCSTLNSGIASTRCDFGLTVGTLTFGATETQKTFVIPITQDSFTEGAELFTVNLSNLTGTRAAFAAPASATVTIDDSAPPAPNAIDDTDAFVRQQYRDFLNREADAAGLAFWTNQINSCGSDVLCRDNKRVNVSAAFFLSIEFQTTGNLVRSFYVATLERPLTNNMPAFVEFERDTQAMQRGLIVGQDNWQQTLNANRDSFMGDFVTRAEFVGGFPTTDTPAQYVDKLYLHAGITPTAGERSNAIAEFGSATTAADTGSRGRALLDVTQNTTFQQREINRSFVQMEYFGYLRRNPNDPPDGDFAGYDFWVNKLTAAGGNYISSDMVKAFITSSEYRGRFGP